MYNYNKIQGVIAVSLRPPKHDAFLRFLMPGDDDSMYYMQGDKIIADETRVESNNSRYESSRFFHAFCLGFIYSVYVCPASVRVVDHPSIRNE